MSTSDYNIQVEPIDGRVTAHINGQRIASSSDAKIMHETRLPSCVYFPPDDVDFSNLQRTALKTFCPFKGTASYWSFKAVDRTLENVAWSYENPLHEAKMLPRHVAFSGNDLIRIDAENGLPPAPAYSHAGGPLSDFVLREAWLCKTPGDLTEQLAGFLVAQGMPVWRLSVGLRTLNPQLAGHTYTWYADRAGVSVRKNRHGDLSQPEYLNSPVRHVSEGLGGVRQSLDGNNPEFDFPIMANLKAAGATDYVVMPLPFSDGQIQTLSLATKEPGGFTTSDLGRVFESSAVISRFYEVMVLRNNAWALLDTYLGHRTGGRVLDGQIRRGEHDIIRAAILVCDLRDSSRLTEQLPRDVYLELLNRFFESAVEPIMDRDGEVLKFMGDSVLAIFPIDAEDAGACLRAADAARDIIERVERSAVDGVDEPVSCSIGVHVGDVTYGNVGSQTRLDFTVTGSAANVTARLTDLAKKLDEPMLFSGDAAGSVAIDMRDLGEHELRNIANAQSVYAP